MTAVLVIRPQPDADRLAALLLEKGFDVRIDPLFTIKFAVEPPERQDYQALLATSRNALRALTKLNAQAPFINLPFFAIGEETEKEARSAGFQCVQSAEIPTSLSLATLIEKTCEFKGKPLLYLAGEKRKSALEANLASSGFKISIWEGYSMQPSATLDEQTLLAFRQKKMDAVLVFSEYASVHFLKITQILEAQALQAPLYFCLSEQVAKPLQERGLAVQIAKTPDLHAMIEDLMHKIH
jgi:uroporphyrinogen-III synthase